MTILSQLETTLVNQHRRLPQLPKDWRIFLADNSWWLTLAFGLYTLVDLRSTIELFHTSRQLQAGYGGLYDGSEVQWLALIALATDIVVLYLVYRAITPLKTKRPLGWRYLYKIALLTTVIGLITAVLAADGSAFFYALAYGAVSLYLVFSVRPSFVRQTHKVAH